jgi:prolyl-tRNA editing enzyme YbaK/EbsC (Cys-tRNA(Pro) deacylase)
VFAAAGHPHAIFKISFNDLKNITSGKIMDISE